MKQRILQSIPDEFNNIQRAFYIYLILCNILTYDDVSFASLDYEINHNDINRIKEINENNNIVLCYEVIALYSKILDILGFNYQINCINDIYGSYHNNISILYNDLHILVEPTQGIINCDLVYAKNKIRLDGFYVWKSNDDKSLEEFNRSIEKVYNYLLKKYNIKYLTETEVINNYINELSYDNASSEEKLKRYITKLESNKLLPIDSIKYCINLKEALFDDPFDLYVFDIYIISSKVKLDTKQVYKPCIVIAFNKNGINDIDNQYYIYDFTNKIETISKEQLQLYFDSDEYKYISAFKRDIPCIIKKFKVKYK